MSPKEIEQPFQLGGWCVEPASNRLILVDLSEQIIRPKVMLVLTYLASHQGEIVTREELINYVWNGNEYVGSRGLTDAIWQLRKSLDIDSQYGPYIETIPKTGYRLLVSVKASTNEKYFKSTKKKLITLPFGLSIAQWGLALFGLLSSISLSILFTQNNPDDKAIVRTIKQLNHLPGAQALPRLSPNGRYVSFTYKEHAYQTGGGKFDLYLQELKPDSAPINLTQKGLPVAYSAWSQNNNDLAFITFVDKQCRIKVISLATRTTTDITNCSAKYAKGLSWSHNQRYLAYTDQLPGNEGVGIVIYDFDTKTKKQLSSNANSEAFFIDLDVIWSKNDDYLIFSRTRGVANDDIYTLDFAGNEKRITHFESSIEGLTLGDENNTIFYSVLNNDLSTLWKSNLITQQHSKLELNDNTAISPGYTSETQTLSYIRRSILTNIIRLDLEQSSEFNREHIIAAAPAADSYPSYSPITNQVVFISNRSGSKQLWSINLGNSKIKQLTNIDQQIYGVSWSPDGTKVAYTASEAKSRYKQINILDIASGEITQLSYNQTDHGPPTWSNDSQHIYTGEFENEYFYLWKYNLQGEKHRVFESTGIYGFEAGDDLFYFTKIERAGIWSYNFKTKQEELVIENLKHGDGSNWVLTESGIYYLTRNKTTDDIRFYHLENDSDQLIYQYPKRHVAIYQNFTYLAKTNQLVFVKRLQPSANIYYTQYP